MKDIFFWKDWEKPYRIAINLLAAIFVLSIVFLVVGIVKGEDFVIHWQVLNIKEPLIVNFESFSKGFFNFNLVADNFIIYQKFQGSELQVNITGSYLFGVIMAIVMTFYLATVTDLSRFWYIVAMGVFIVFMVNLKLEHLLIFDRIDRLPLIIIFLILLPVSYYFHAINKNISLLMRVLVFAIVISILGVAIEYTAEPANPFLYIINYGVLGVLIITCVFILMVSHEIINGFVYLLTSSTTMQGKNNMRHFLVISVFYLGNITILYLYETRIIDWEFYYINPYVLLVVSSIIGFWGLITRSTTFSNAVPFYPLAPILYLSIGALSLSTTAFFFVTGNDPILEVIEDTIIYGHLGFGGIFLIYILANFGALMGKSVPVYKVIYKPTAMPYFTFRFAGLIAVAAFFLKENIEVPIYHSLSGYYNGIGDLYTANREYYVAEQYYKLGSDYGYQNHRSNYALASLASKQGDLVSASYFYEFAINKRPTEYAIVNLSNTQIANDEFLDGLFTLRDGLDVFPASGPLMVNSGLALKQTEILDSAAIFFDMASNYGVSERLGKNNLLALVSENNWALDPDSLKDEYYLEGNEVAEVNYSVVLNQNKKPGNYIPNFPADSILGLVSSSRVINHAMNSFIQGDETFLPVLDSLSKKIENFRYADELEFVLALGYYKNDRIDKAISILKILAANDLSKAGFYNNMIGLMVLKHNAWDVASAYFDNAYQMQFSESLLNKSISLMEAGARVEARESWDQLLRINPDFSLPASMIHVMEISPTDLDTLEDRILYQYLRYYAEDLTPEIFNSAIEGFENPVYLESLILNNASKLIQQLDFTGAAKLLSEMSVTNSAMAEEHRLLQLIVNSETGLDLKEQDLELINSNIKGEHSSLKRYLRALHASSKNDSVMAANEFERLGFGNPFFIPGVVKAVDFFNNSNPGNPIAYSILVEAVQYNPKNAILWENYVEECVRRGYDNYVDHGLQELRSILDENAYKGFLEQYEIWKAEYEEVEFD